MENNHEKKVGQKDEVEASSLSSVDDIQHLVFSSSKSAMENNHEKKVGHKDEAVASSSFSAGDIQHLEKKVGDKDKDEAEVSPSFSVNGIQHLVPSSSTSNMEIKQEKKVGDKDEDGLSNTLTSEKEEEKKKEMKMKLFHHLLQIIVTT
eukprot:6067911-Ditylum_brightwellii.AAC.1